MEKSKKMEKAISSYVIGFFFSLSLTLVAYISVVSNKNTSVALFSPEFLMIWILALGFLQLLVQLLFFLHLGREKKPYFNLIFLMLTAGMIFTVIVASIWIMQHLNRNMTPKQMQNYVHDQSGF